MTDQLALAHGVVLSRRRMGQPLDLEIPSADLLGAGASLHLLVTFRWLDRLAG